MTAAPSESALRIVSLDLRQFAGVTPESAFSLTELAPGINLIFGPNGCGKSTTARALQALLWPKSSLEYRDISAVVQRGSSEWRLSFRGRELQCFVKGEAVPPPAWSPPETRRRYHWSLQNLLRDQDEDLARQIAREMAGGIDFQKLAADLNWQKKPSAPAKLHQNYLAAERKLRETRERQQGLLQEAGQLSSLTREMQSQAESAARIPVLEMVKEFQEKSRSLEELRTQLAAFPPGMENLHGDDAANLERLQQEEAGLNAGLLELQAQREALGSGEKDWALFGSRDFAESRRELENTLDALRELQHELNDAEKTLSELEAKEQSLRTGIGIHRQAALNLGEGFDFPELRAWIQLVFRQLECQERKQLLTEALQTAESAGPPLDLDTLREARLNLESWLKNQQPPARLPQLPLLLSQLILAGLLIYLVATRGMPWPWLLLACPVPLVHVYLKRQMKDRFAAELQARHPDTVPQPTAWETAAVRENLKALDQAIRDQHAFDLLESDRRRLQEVEKNLGATKADINRHQQSLQAAGLELNPDPLWLAHFLGSVQTWRELRTGLAAAEARKAQLEARGESLQEGLSRQLQTWGQTTQGLSLFTAANCLGERMERELERRQKSEQLTLSLGHRQQQLQTCRQAIRSICDRVGLSEPDAETLRQRSERRGDWADTLRTSETLQARLSELRILLGEHLPLTEQPPESVDQEKLQAEAARQRELSLRDQISKLEQRIDDQRRGRNLHEAEEALSECREALQAERHQHLETRMGMEILSWLQEQCRSRDRSRVLEEANRNLVRFSRSTLQLHLSTDEGEGEFTASRPGRSALPLTRLSAGERSQVLMAVRLAFLKLNESAPLPLLVDEALGTTDDARGEQIIRSLIEVSRQGRQIFYFTAQQDEVDKWRQILGEEQEPAQIIDLAALRRGSASALPPQRIPKPAAPADYRRQPGESLGDWAARLEIPAWEPPQPVEQLPLWLLIHEQPALLQLLYEQGIRTAGQWLIYEQSGALSGRIRPERRLTLTRQIRALQALRRAWQIGRPPRLPASVLVESGIVSERFTADLVQLLERVEGDAARLIKALDDKAVSGFLQKKTRELESWLREAEYFADRSPLSADEIKAGVMAEFADENAEDLPWATLHQLIFPEPHTSEP